MCLEMKEVLGGEEERATCPPLVISRKSFQHEKLQSGAL